MVPPPFPDSGGSPTRGPLRLETRLAAAYALVACGLLLWPFDFSWPYHMRRNGASWLTHGGVELRDVGVVRTAGSASPLTRALREAPGLTVEIWVRTSSTRQAGPARIVSLSGGTLARNLMLGQAGSALVMRLRTASTDRDGQPALRVPGVFDEIRLRHVAVTYDGSSDRVYLDGRLEREARLRSGGLENWDPRFPLLLGNETTGTRPWRGRLLLLGFYRRALSGEEVARNRAAGPPSAAGTPAERPSRASDGLVALYRFGADGGGGGAANPVALGIPGRLRVGERELLVIRDRGGALDRIVNLLAFLPFGLLADRALGRRSLRSAVSLLLGVAAFTLCMESLQYLLAERVSSLRDAALNVAGAGIGVALARALPVRAREPDPTPPGRPGAGDPPVG